MIGRLPYKTKQFFLLLIKLSIVIGAFYFIYIKISSNVYLDINEFFAFLVENEVISFKNASILIVLSIFNWFFEILKWKKLVSVVTSISLYDALKQSLSALTASLFTPHRIGDYPAKALYFKRKLRKQIVLLNVLGHSSQMVATTIFGILGISMFMTYYGFDILNVRLMKLISIMCVLLSITIFGMQHTHFKIQGYSIQDILDYIRKLPRSVFVTTLGLAVVRYVIFSFQFYVLLLIFAVDVSYYNAMIVITSMYFLSSILPSVFMFDVVVKGSISLYLFESVGVNNLTILCVITIMWLLNVVLPSIVGSIYVMNFKLTSETPSIVQS